MSKNESPVAIIAHTVTSAYSLDTVKAENLMYTFIGLYSVSQNVQNGLITSIWIYNRENLLTKAH